MSFLGRTIFLFFALFLLSSCENDNVTQIEWMIPMQPSNDQHTTSALDKTMPDWAEKEGMAIDIMLLSKSRAQTWSYHLTKDVSVKHRNLTIELLGVSQYLRVGAAGYIEDQSVNNPAAFVRIFKHEHIVYEGWLYQEFPELFGLEDPEWQVWLKHVSP
ncbi:MAG: DUF2155 domain-containing protein [Mariprofundaceae bacterium]|nr:DUF2155 domain-containing protein [Mariprofundaceae bacterium]